MTIVADDVAEQEARALPNRGPICFGPDGLLEPGIVEAYNTYGFYVFEGVIDEGEIAEARAEVDAVLARAPYPTSKSPTDRNGQPALGVGDAVSPFIMAAPLSDPVGGTRANNGRHPVKMLEPSPTDDAPPEITYLILRPLEVLETFLCIYGHPQLLKVAESINGPDFTPFNEVVFVKEPGLGPSVAWHQDGQTHWDNPAWEPNIHGFNLQVQLYGSTPGNGVWIIPGSHTWGKADIRSMFEPDAESDRLPDAVPMVCGPGDCFITNRQAVHGSYANASDDRRVTVNFGFHKRSSVLDQQGVLSGKGNVYTDDYIRERARCIALAIDARSQRFVDETPYTYAPLAGEEDQNRDTVQNRAEILTNYNKRDIGI